MVLFLRPHLVLRLHQSFMSFHLPLFKSVLFIRSQLASSDSIRMRDTRRVQSLQARRQCKFCVRDLKTRQHGQPRAMALGFLWVLVDLNI